MFTVEGIERQAMVKLLDTYAGFFATPLSGLDLGPASML